MAEDNRKTELSISVRNLVEFVLREGDIDNRRTASPENAMQEGGRIHRKIQRRMGSEYQAEVALKYLYETDSYTIVVEGRADGIITGTGPGREGVRPLITVDEIKGTYRELQKLKAAVPVHLAQAKCYAYIYAQQKGLAEIRVHMTYCNMDTEEIKYFHHDHTFRELE